MDRVERIDKMKKQILIGTDSFIYVELVNREIRNIFAKYQGEAAMAF